MDKMGTTHHCLLLLLCMVSTYPRSIDAQVNIDDCSSDPCENGGTCMDHLNHFTCDCSPGWTGDTCSVNINECSSNPCENGGRCRDQINHFTCDCSPGWIGDTCSVNINECSSNPCENGGICRDQINHFTCDCSPGWFGNTCSVQDSTPAPPVATLSPLVCDLDIFFLVDAIDETLLSEMSLVIQQVTNGLNVGAIGQGARVGLRSFGNTQQRIFQYAHSQSFIEIAASNIQPINGTNNLPVALQAFLNGDPVDAFPRGEYQTSLHQNRKILLVIMSDLNVDQIYVNNLVALRNQLQSIPTVLVSFNNQINHGLVKNFGNPVQVLHTVGFSVATANTIINQVVNPTCRSGMNLTPRTVG